jgi:hypothetical protein
MKTYISQIERRTIIRQLQSWGIIGYDLDNAYPQRMLELVAQSPTATNCWEKRAKFIAGNGFEDENLSKFVVNEQGLTLAKLLKRIAVDKALFTSFGIHINYNANYAISDVHYVKFEDIRQGDPDNENMRDKFAVYFDWGRKTWKNITTSKIDYIHRYNPNPDVIREQVIEAGGWDNYKGQLYYFNPEIDDYPLIIADSVWEDFETEAGIKIFANREVNVGFMPSVMISQKQRREEADSDDSLDDGVGGFRRPTQIEIDLGQFQGAKNGQKILHMEYQNDDEKPELTPFPIQNNDKLFELTEKSVENRIIKGFFVPKELVNSEKSTGLSNGGEKKEAIREFNDNTAPDRLELIESLSEIFSHFYTPVPTQNWNILEVPAEIAEDILGARAGVSINQLLLSALPKENKVAALVSVYGIEKSEAEAMCPEDGAFTPQQVKTNQNTEGAI